MADATANSRSTAVATGNSRDELRFVAQVVAVFAIAAGATFLELEA